MANHLIGRQIIELEVAESHLAQRLQASASRLCRDLLPERLEAMLDKIAGDDTVIQIDKLEIDLGELDQKSFETVFARKVQEILEKQIIELKTHASPSSALGTQGSGKDSKPQLTSQSSQENAFDIWLEILEKGFSTQLQLPEKLDVVTRDLIGFLKEYDSLKDRLRDLLQTSPEATFRLSEMLHDETVQRLWEMFRSPAWIWTWWNMWKQENKSLSLRHLLHAMVVWSLQRNRDSQQLVERLYPFIGSTFQSDSLHSIPDINHEAFSDWAKLFLKKSTISTEEREVIEGLEEKLEQRIQPAEQEKNIEPKEEDIDSPLYVPYCGIVLLHGFLSPFFDNLGLLEAGTFTNPDTQNRAINLLAYLATGSTDVPEHELPIAKILCGLPLSYPIERIGELSAFEQQECDDLLAAIIKHWGALKNTSPDGLRDAFLQRAGKLAQQQDGWQLTVETKAQDILLGSLHWGISMIQHPWMPKMLQVTWT